MNASKTRPARKTAPQKLKIPLKIQKALEKADEKTKAFVLETIRLKELGLLDKLR